MGYRGKEEGSGDDKIVSAGRREMNEQGAPAIEAPAGGPTTRARHRKAHRAGASGGMGTEQASRQEDDHDKNARTTERVITYNVGGWNKVEALTDLICGMRRDDRPAVLAMQETRGNACGQKTRGGAGTLWATGHRTEQGVLVWGVGFLVRGDIEHSLCFLE